MKHKKGFSIMEVPTLGMVLVVIAVTLGIGATILNQVKGTQTTDSYAYNITLAGEESLSDFADWQGTYSVIIAAAVVIGIIGSYLFFKSRQ